MANVHNKLEERLNKEGYFKNPLVHALQKDKTGPKQFVLIVDSSYNKHSSQKKTWSIWLMVLSLKKYYVWGPGGSRGYTSKTHITATFRKPHKQTQKRDSLTVSPDTAHWGSGHGHHTFTAGNNRSIRHHLLVSLDAIIFYNKMISNHVNFFWFLHGLYNNTLKYSNKYSKSLPLPACLLIKHYLYYFTYTLKSYAWWCLLMRSILLVSIMWVLLVYRRVESY